MNILTKPKMNHTRNLFESIEEIQGKVLMAITPLNRDGDVLCLVEERYIVDVDHRDIQQYGVEGKT